jgi:transcriptional regulator with XRE-family HTH domain
VEATIVMSDNESRSTPSRSALAKIVGEQLKAAREAKKLNLTAFAKMIGVKRTALSNYEAGSRLIREDVLLRSEEVLALVPGTLAGLLYGEKEERFTLDVLAKRDEFLDQVLLHFGTIDGSVGARGDESESAQARLNRLMQETARERAAKAWSKERRIDALIKRILPLVPGDRVFRTRAAAIDVGRKILEAVSYGPLPYPREPRHDGDEDARISQILITYTSGRIGERIEALVRALNNNFEVHVGYRLSDRIDDDDQFNLFMHMVEIAGAGRNRYAARSIGWAPKSPTPESDEFIPEAMVIPGVMALEFKGPNLAVFYDAQRHRDDVQRLTDQLRVALWRSPYLFQVFNSTADGASRRLPENASLDSVNPNLKRLNGESVPPPVARLNFNNAIKPRLNGDTFLRKDGLSIFIFMPLEIDLARITRGAPKRSDDWYLTARMLVDQRKDHLEAFKELLERHDSVHMISLDGVQKMVKGEQRPDGTWIRKRGWIQDDWLREELTPREMYLYLGNVLQMLKKHPEKLKIALSDAFDGKQPDNAPAQPLVYFIGSVRDDRSPNDDEVEGGVVYFEVFPTTASQDQKPGDPASKPDQDPTANPEHALEIDIEVRGRVIAEIFRRAQLAEFEEANADEKRSRAYVIERLTAWHQELDQELFQRDKPIKRNRRVAPPIAHQKVKRRAPGS